MRTDTADELSTGHRCTLAALGWGARARGTSISLCLCASRASRSNDDVTFSGTGAGAAAAAAGAAAAADAPAADADGAGLLIMKSMATSRLRQDVAASAARLACSSKPISHRFWSSRGSTAAGSPVAERSCSRSPVDDIPVGCTSPGAVCQRKREDGEQISANREWKHPCLLDFGASIISE